MHTLESYNLEPIIKEGKGFKLWLKLHKKFEDHQIKEYHNDPDNFSIEYKRKDATRKISKNIEDSIMKELTIEKKLIADPQSSSKII